MTIADKPKINNKDMFSKKEELIKRISLANDDTIDVIKIITTNGRLDRRKIRYIAKENKDKGTIIRSLPNDFEVLMASASTATSLPKSKKAKVKEKKKKEVRRHYK